MRFGDHPGLWGLIGYAVAGAALVALMLLVSYLAGERRDRESEQPYEAGMLPTGGAESPVSVRFYLVAMMFLVFDVEAVFVLAWAVAARELGWAGYAEVALFIAVLVAAWFYLWRIGALDWGTSALFAARRRARARVEPEREEAGGGVVVEPGE